MKAILILAMLAISCYGVDSAKRKPATVFTDDKGFTVVELFTSEGCSSCPPADELVSRIVKEDHPNVYVLSYHVDYWNRLGWKDVFSQAAFSERQKQYADHLSLEGVYTPQIVVNGSTEFVGSNESKLRAAIKNKVARKADFEVKVKSKDDSTLHLIYSGIGSQPVLLNFALVQPEATTDVKRGENGGKKLHHVNVVRALKTIETKGDGGVADINIPGGLAGNNLQLISFTQDKDSFKIISATKTNISM